MSLKIEKKTLFELNNYSATNNWSEKLLNEVIELSENWFELGATEVAFFLDYEGRLLVCKCVYPYYSNDNYLPDKKEMALLLRRFSPINLPPVPKNSIESPYVKRLAKNNGYWVGNEVIIIMKNENTNSYEQIFEGIELRNNATNLKNTMANYYSELFELNEDIKNLWLRPMVRIAESMEKEADEKTGFVTLQKLVHRISFTLPETKRNGQFTASFLAKILEKTTVVIEELSESFSIPFKLDLFTAGFGKSSSILFADIETENPNENVDPKLLGQIEERVSQVISDTLQILTSENKTEAIEKFIEKTKLTPSSAIRIVESIQGIAPGPKSESNEIQIFIPSQLKVNSIKNTDRKELGKALKELRVLKKENLEKEAEVIEGELGGLEEFSNEIEHYFTIKVGSSKRKVYYEANDQLQKKVDAALHSNVKVRVIWKSGKWTFKNWI